MLLVSFTKYVFFNTFISKHLIETIRHQISFLAVFFNTFISKHLIETIRHQTSFLAVFSSKII
jgi:hypothetical protein